MSKIDIIKDQLQSIEAKSTSIKKSDFTKAKNLFNNALESEWRSTYVDFYLENNKIIEDESKSDGSILSDLYYSSPAFHTIEKKSEKLLKQAQGLTNTLAKKAIDIAMETMNKFIPFVETINSIKNHADINASEKLQKKANEKDPIAAIPLASRASITLINNKLTSEVESHKDGLKNHFIGVLSSIVNSYIIRPESDRVLELNKVSNPKISKDHQIILQRCLERVGSIPNMIHSSGSKPPYTLRADYKDYLSDLADHYTNQIVSQYVEKHVKKLAAITERLPAIDKISMHTRLERGSLDSKIGLNFSDKSSFSVRSQTVISFTQNGIVTRYPTTFHDVVDSNGKMVGKKLSEAEMIDWSEGKFSSNHDSSFSM